MTVKESEIVAKEFRLFIKKILKDKETAISHLKKAGIVTKKGKLTKAYQ